MYELHWAPDTGAFVIHAALEQARDRVGADYRRVVVDMGAGGHKEPAYLALNPLGQVPTLVLPDGQVVTESAAMVIHLAEAFPEAGLLPAAGHVDRPKALRWLLFLAMNIYGDNLRYNAPGRFTDEPAGAAAVRRSAAARLERFWQLVDAALEPGPFLLGETCSAVDLYCAMMTDWALAREQVFGRAPRVARAFELVCAQPVVARIAEENSLVP